MLGRNSLVVLVASLLVAVPTAGVALAAGTTTTADGGTTAATTGTADDSAAAPGARVSGAVGMAGAEVEGELSTRSLQARLDRANTTDARAAVVAAQTNESRERLTALRAERERLREARENGSISRGEYRARLATLSVRIRSLERVSNATADAAADLPEEALRARGVDPAAVRSMSREAANLSGPEVAAAAREFGGRGNAAGRGPPGNASAPGAASDAPDVADRPNRPVGGGNESVDGNGSDDAAGNRSVGAAGTRSVGGGERPDATGPPNRSTGSEGERPDATNRTHGTDSTQLIRDV